MKGHEHFREAEKLLGYAKDLRDETYLKAAQVHATLAGAVALSNVVKLLASVDADIADAELPHAEPLVMCNAAPADDGPERCGLPVSHDGLHEHDAGGGRIVSWSTPAELRTVAPEPLYQATTANMHMEMPR